MYGKGLLKAEERMRYWSVQEDTYTENDDKELLKMIPSRHGTKNQCN